MVYSIIYGLEDIKVHISSESKYSFFRVISRNSSLVRYSQKA